MHIHTYIHTYIRTYLLHTYKPYIKNIHKYMHTYKTYIRKYKKVDIYTYSTDI